MAWVARRNGRRFELVWAIAAASLALFAATAMRASGAGTPSVPPATEAQAQQPEVPVPAQEQDEDMQAWMRARQYIGETRCAECHTKEADRYYGGVHARVWNPRAPAATNACETCHGPAREHFVDPETRGLIKHFPAMSAAEINETCATCHNRREHTLWDGSAHDARSMSCVSCHSVHGSRSEPLMLRASITETCASCHRDNAAKLQRSAHMPVREGKMECSSCHNPHGSTNVRLLRAGNTVNESCVSCHTEKRGPFLWEHPPVRESCVTCHDPHGSSNDRMLLARSPMLCQRCHIATRHPSTVYDLGSFAAGSNRVIGRGCVNCHSNIHGSNHPAGIMFQR
jgi:DmsE family decaheme c-type cytochrome